MERWLPVVDWEDWYEVSDRGQVRSLDRIVTQVNRWGSLTTRRHWGHILAPVLNKRGYFQVKLCRNGQRETWHVHCLVLRAFVGACPEGQESLHGPGGQQDNRWPENLCYGTHWQNMMEKYRDGTMLSGERHGNSRLTEDRVREIRRRYVPRVVTQQVLADEYDVSVTTISIVLAGKVWADVGT
jgi:NUMOD4 motif